MNGIVLVFYYCIGKKTAHSGVVKKSRTEHFCSIRLGTGVFEELPEDGFLRRRGRTGNGAVGQLRVGFRRPLSGHGVPDEVQQKTLPEPIVPSDQIEARTESEIELLQRADIGCVQVFLSSFFPTNRLCPAYLYSGQVCRFALLPTGILVLYELEPRLAPRRNATSARPKRTVSKPQTVLKLSMRLV